MNINRAKEILREVLENDRIAEDNSHKKALTEALKYLDNKDTISIEWSVEDVLGIAKEEKKKCTKQQARSILHEMERHHDCEYGITWDTIRAYF